MELNKFVNIETDIKYINSEIDSQECKYIDDIIDKLDDSAMLGSGGYGTVLALSIPKLGTKKYALKAQKLQIESKILPKLKINNKEAYIFNTEAEKEYLIGRLLSSAYTNLECINFFNMYDYKQCEDGQIAYILMDKLSGSFRSGANCISLKDYNKHCNDEDILLSSVVQLLFSIAFYQTKWSISHNDLHVDNIFVEYVTKETEFNGKKLIEADYYHYKVGDKDFYIPISPVIVKIGDVGLAEKYSEPMIISEDVYCNINKDTSNTYGCRGIEGFAEIPFKYTPQYDAFLSISTMISDNKYNNNFLRKTYDYFRGTNCENSITRPYKDYKPLCNLSELPTALDYFVKSDILNKCNKKPEGLIITLGVIEIHEDVKDQIAKPYKISKRTALTTNNNFMNESIILEVPDNINVILEYKRKYDNPSYMDSKDDISWKMRSILVKWMYDACTNFRLSYQCFGCAVRILDIYLSKSSNKFSRQKLQLAGVSSIGLAHDYYNNVYITRSNLSQITNYAYSNEEIINFKKKMMNIDTIDAYYDPTPYNVVGYYVNEYFDDMKDKILEAVIYIISMFTIYKESLLYEIDDIAKASCLMIGRLTNYKFNKSKDMDTPITMKILTDIEKTIGGKDSKMIYEEYTMLMYNVFDKRV